MFDFGIFCHLLRLMGIYRVEGGVGYLKSFVLSFPFFPFLFFFFLFFSFLFFVLFFSSFSSFLSLSQGPLWLWGPWTLSAHATQSLRHCISLDTAGKIIGIIHHYYLRGLLVAFHDEVEHFCSIIPPPIYRHFRLAFPYPQLKVPCW